MRLSEWRPRSPFRDSVATKVLATIESTLSVLGADKDPHCWVVWGDDSGSRYMLLVPTAAGLLQIAVRVNVPGEGPRSGGKLVRWSRVQLGELAVEQQGGHRLVTFQVETHVLHGADADADAVAAFALGLFAAVDGQAATFASASKSPTARKPAKPASGLPVPKEAAR